MDRIQLKTMYQTAVKYGDSINMARIRKVASMNRIKLS